METGERSEAPVLERGKQLCQPIPSAQISIFSSQFQDACCIEFEGQLGKALVRP